jgi:hypothetical protein
LKRRALAVALAACVLLGADAAEPPAPTLDFLLLQLSGSPGTKAQFHERRFLSLLSGPLESQGTLYYQPPDRLARITTAPAKTRLVFDLGRMRFQDEAGSSDLALAERPAAQAWAENLLAIFRANRAELESRHRLEYHAEGARWELRLTPIAPPLDRHFASIKLVGAGRALREIDVVEVDGDSVQMLFDESDPEHVFTAEESLEVFGARTGQ